MKRAVFRSLAVLLGILLAALLGEWALRLTGYSPLYFNALNSFHEPHPLVGYRGKPNFEGRFRKPDFDVVIAHDRTFESCPFPYHVRLEEGQIVEQNLVGR